MLTPQLYVQHCNHESVEIKFGVDEPKVRPLCGLCGARIEEAPIGPLVSTVEGDEPVCLDCLPEGMANVLQSARAANWPEDQAENVSGQPQRAPAAAALEIEFSNLSGFDASCETCGRHFQTRIGPVAVEKTTGEPVCDGCLPKPLRAQLEKARSGYWAEQEAREFVRSGPEIPASGHARKRAALTLSQRQNLDTRDFGQMPDLPF